MKTFLFWLTVVMGAVFSLYQVKYQVRDMKSDVDRLEAELEEEYEALHVLEAEWTYLNRPGRVQELAKKHLALEPVSASQMTNAVVVGGLPEKQDTGVIPASGKKQAR